MNTSRILRSQTLCQIRFSPMTKARPQFLGGKRPLHLLSVMCVLSLAASIILATQLAPVSAASAANASAADTSAADWPIYESDPQHTGSNNGENVLTPPLTLQWTLPNTIYAT